MRAPIHARAERQHMGTVGVTRNGTITTMAAARIIQADDGTARRIAKASDRRIFRRRGRISTFVGENQQAKARINAIAMMKTSRTRISKCSLREDCSCQIACAS